MQLIQKSLIKRQFLVKDNEEYKKGWIWYYLGLIAKEE